MAVQDTTSPKQFFEQLKHIIIAVIDEEGRPWAVPVAVQRYDAGTVEWMSKTNTVHSKAIARSVEVALTAFDGATGYGVYAHARAKKILALPGIGRYRAEIYEAWYTDASRKKMPIPLDTL